MSDDLLPCPFCGGGVSVTTTERVGGIVCDAPSECIGSGLLIVFDLEDMETAIAAWNRRAVPATDAREKALREAAAVADRLHYPDETKVSASIRDAILALIGEGRT